MKENLNGAQCWNSWPPTTLCRGIDTSTSHLSTPQIPMHHGKHCQPSPLFATSSRSTLLPRGDDFEAVGAAGPDTKVTLEIPAELSAVHLEQKFDLAQLEWYFEDVDTPTWVTSIRSDAQPLPVMENWAEHLRLRYVHIWSHIRYALMGFIYFSGIFVYWWDNGRLIQWENNPIPFFWKFLLVLPGCRLGIYQTKTLSFLGPINSGRSLEPLVQINVDTLKLLMEFLVPTIKNDSDNQNGHTIELAHASHMRHPRTARLILCGVITMTGK